MIVGGKRDRLIEMNFTDMIEDSLTALGWFDSDNSLMDGTLEILDEPVDSIIEVKPNKIAVTAENSFGEDAEMGSGLENIRWEYYVEIFAESKAVGKHLSGDIRDILKGKMPSIGRSEPLFVVYDTTVATPPELFTCGIEEVEDQRTHSFSDSIRQYWWTVACVVTDNYWNEND